MEARLLLIDGNSLFHRAYHALPPLSDAHGEMANAVFGFSSMLIKAIGEIKPTYVACAFDTQAPTFRHIEFEKYKAQRVAPPPDLYPQLPKVKKVLDAFGIPYFEKEGYEADDIIATIASRVVNSSQSTVHSKDKTANEVIILSGDRDVLQLVDGNIKVQMPGWNLPAGKKGLKETTLFGAMEVKEKYGIVPEQMVDYKSLIGDPSDNVPGIAGIGPKTASQLLQKYQTLENLFNHVAEVPDTLRQKLEAGKETALAAKKLVELDRNIDLPLVIDDLRFKPNWAKVKREYEDLGFKSIVNKLPGVKNTSDAGPDSSEVDPDRKSNKKTKNSNQLELI